MPPGAHERQLYSLYTDLGVLTRGDCLVRDRASIYVDGRDYGMVDMGEWLFDRSLFEFLKFEFKYSAEDVRNRTGEDDKLLRDMVQLGIATACSRRATLIYSLGGFSNRHSAPAQLRSTASRGSI
jgi:hypothetical protein